MFRASEQRIFLCKHEHSQMLALQEKSNKRLPSLKAEHASPCKNIRARSNNRAPTKLLRTSFRGESYNFAKTAKRQGRIHELFLWCSQLNFLVLFYLSENYSFTSHGYVSGNMFEFKRNNSVTDVAWSKMGRKPLQLKGSLFQWLTLRLYIHLMIWRQFYIFCLFEKNSTEVSFNWRRGTASIMTKPRQPWARIVCTTLALSQNDD